MSLRSLLHLLALVAGLVGFALLVDRVGWDALAAVRGAGVWFVWIALIDLASVFTDSAAVYCFTRAEAPVPFWRAFAAQASGIAINRLTPGNTLGEPIKATMLMDHIDSPARKQIAVSAIVKFNIATMYVALIVVVIGVPLTLLNLQLPSRVEIAVWIATAVIIALLVALALLLRRGAIASLIGASRSLGLVSDVRAARWTKRIESIDASIRAFNDAHSRRGIACVAASRILHFAATIAVLHAAAVPMTAPVVIGMLSVGILVQWVSNFVPLGLGLADGTNYILYGALGSSGIAGLAFTMVNRLRTCVLAGMGLAVMMLANLFDRASGVRRSTDMPSAERTEAAATPRRA